MLALQPDGSDPIAATNDGWQLVPESCKDEQIMPRNIHEDHPVSSRFALALLVPAFVACDPEIEAPDDRTEIIDRDLQEEDVDESPIDQFTHLGERGDYAGFDVERQIDLYDADGDSYPDVTEQIGGTDFFDPSSTPGASEDAIFPAASCRAGYVQAGARLCISAVAKNATTYLNATSICRNSFGQVCSYEDLTYLYFNSGLDATYNPGAGHWIGNMVGDDDVFCGNKSITFNNDPDIYNFEGTCGKSGSHPYWCCHDDQS